MFDKNNEYLHFTGRWPSQPPPPKVVEEAEPEPRWMQRDEALGLGETR